MGSNISHTSLFHNDDVELIINFDTPFSLSDIGNLFVRLNYGEISQIIKDMSNELIFNIPRTQIPDDLVLEVLNIENKTLYSKNINSHEICIDIKKQFVIDSGVIPLFTLYTYLSPYNFSIPTSIKGKEFLGFSILKLITHRVNEERFTLFSSINTIVSYIFIFENNITKRTAEISGEILNLDRNCIIIPFSRSTNEDFYQEDLTPSNISVRVIVNSEMSNAFETVIQISDICSEDEKVVVVSLEKFVL
jgi:hypothetical protein